jgi:hypothetical protein
MPRPYERYGWRPVPWIGIFCAWSTSCCSAYMQAAASSIRRTNGKRDQRDTAGEYGQRRDHELYVRRDGSPLRTRPLRLHRLPRLSHPTSPTLTGPESPRDMADFLEIL